jgi:SAM-dependent methyltransferase
MDNNKVLEKQKDWFESWFDTTYYHTLYQHRDDSEAQLFIDRLIDFLQPKKDAKILDLACGKGRHAFHLAQKALQVTGVDLSKENIVMAREFEQENLQFFEHDMREVFQPKAFDYILNLFTSFGFFDNDEAHAKTIRNLAKGLKDKGVFVFDFLNFYQVEANLIPIETKTIDGITFNIKRFIKNGFIHKQIDFDADGQAWSFEERVRGLTVEELEIMFKKAGLEILHTFGDYELNGFNRKSKRLILIGCLK